MLTPGRYTPRSKPHRTLPTATRAQSVRKLPETRIPRRFAHVVVVVRHPVAGPPRGGGGWFEVIRLNFVLTGANCVICCTKQKIILRFKIAVKKKCINRAPRLGHSSFGWATAAGSEGVVVRRVVYSVVN